MTLNHLGCFGVFILAQGLGMVEVHTEFYVVSSAVHNFMSSLYIQNLMFVFFFLLIAINDYCFVLE